MAQSFIDLWGYNLPENTEGVSDAEWASIMSVIFGDIISRYYEDQDTDDTDRIYRMEEAKQLQDILDAIAAGEATIEDLKALEFDYLSEVPGFNDWYESTVNGAVATEEVVDINEKENQTVKDLTEEQVEQTEDEVADTETVTNEPEREVVDEWTDPNTGETYRVLRGFIHGRDVLVRVTVDPKTGEETVRVIDDGYHGNRPLDEFGSYQDTDGDGVVDAYIVGQWNPVTNQYEEKQVYSQEINDYIVEQQKQYEDIISQEGWDDLPDWKKNEILVDKGYVPIYGDGSTEDPDLVVSEEPEDQGSIVDQVKAKFPTWEDIWNKVKDQVPDSPEEWGDAVRGILEAAGVDLPDGDPDAIADILKGGYGVIFDPATTIITDPMSGLIFIPGIPVGLPPNSTVIGTIEDILDDPYGTVTDKINEVLGTVVNNPGDILTGILGGTTEVPQEVWDWILGGVLVDEVVDWIKDAGGEVIDQVTTPPIGGEEEAVEEAAEEVVQEAVEEQVDAANLGGNDTVVGDIDPDLAGDLDNIFKGDTLDYYKDDFPDPNVLSGAGELNGEEFVESPELSGVDDNLSGGGGGSGSVGMSDPTQFMTSIPYAPPVIEAIQQRPEEDQFAKLMQQANMFNTKDYNAQLDGVIARGMFEGMA